jgi:hypothetical protein
VAHLVEALWFRFSMGSLEFFIDLILPPPHYGPGVDSNSNRNEYQEYLLGEKGIGGRCVRLTTLPLSGRLNLLEP